MLKHEHMVGIIVSGSRACFEANLAGLACAGAGSSVVEIQKDEEFAKVVKGEARESETSETKCCRAELSVKVE